MNRSAKIALIYTATAAISAGIIYTGMWLRKGLHAVPVPMAVNTGKKPGSEPWFHIDKELVTTNQENRQISIPRDLKGKVTVLAQFFAVCPMCAQRNGTDLKELAEAFKGHPDFHVACISVDPAADNVERLKEYGEALGADPERWWFLTTGDEKSAHEYVEKELKFFSVKHRTDPVDIQTNGRFAHDLAFLLVDRDGNVIGKWPLSDAASPEGRKLDPENYQRLKDDLYARIRAELAKKTP